MTNNDEQQDRLVRLLSPEIRIPRTAAEPTGPVGEELRRLIMGLSTPDAPEVGAAKHRTSWSLRRRLGFAIPAVAGLAALAFVVTAVLPGSSGVGPAPAQADALRFSQDNGYLTVRIVDPAADPKRYKAELAQHGLDIDLTLAPVEPDQIGRVVFQEQDNGNGPSLKEIEAPGRCSANGNCSVAIQVPLNYQGYAQIVFGRAPRPGEDTPVLSPEQQKQLDSLVGQRVSDARRLLAARGQAITYRVGYESLEAPADQVPGSWYVYQVAPLSQKVVVLWASADGKPPAPTHPNASTQPSSGPSTR